MDGSVNNLPVANGRLTGYFPRHLHLPDLENHQSDAKEKRRATKYEWLNARLFFFLRYQVIRNLLYPRKALRGLVTNITRYIYPGRQLRPSCRTTSQVSIVLDSPFCKNLGSRLATKCPGYDRYATGRCIRSHENVQSVKNWRLSLPLFPTWLAHLGSPILRVFISRISAKLATCNKSLLLKKRTSCIGELGHSAPPEIRRHA
jgi:hypothetical protein